MDTAKFHQRLAEAQKNGKLNLGFCELTSLPVSFIKEIKARAPKQAASARGRRSAVGLKRGTIPAPRVSPPPFPDAAQ